MKKTYPKTIAKEFTIPMLRLISEASASSFYNYLPGDNSDQDGIAWFYYYKKLKKARDFLMSYDFGSVELFRKYYELRDSIRKLVSTFEYVDSLPHFWFLANPKLLESTAFSGFVNGRTGEEVDDKKVTFELIDAFISLSLSILPEECRKEMNGLISSEDIKVSPLSAKEKEALRNELTEFKTGREYAVLIKEEIVLRLKLIEKYMGSSVQQNLSDYALEIKENVEKNSENIVYYVLEDDERVYLLCISGEVLYWENQRPSKGQLGVFAFGYGEYSSHPKKSGYGQLKLD